MRVSKVMPSGMGGETDGLDLLSWERNPTAFIDPKPGLFARPGQQVGKACGWGGGSFAWRQQLFLERRCFFSCLFFLGEEKGTAVLSPPWAVADNPFHIFTSALSKEGVPIWRSRQRF